MIDIQITMPDGSITRVRKVSPVPTRRGAEQYEREVRAALLEGTQQFSGGAQESNLRLGTGEREDAASGWPPKLPKRFGFWRLSWRRLLWRSPEVCGDGRSARHRG